MGEVIMISSGKGGVGKTMFAANMGAVLAQKGASVALIDMNIGMRNLDICLGMENRIVFDLTDAVIGICDLKQALVRDRRFPELYLISAAQSREKARILPVEMKDLCGELADRYDYVIIDAPSGCGEDFRLAAAGAEKAVLLTVPDYGALRDAEALDHLMETMGIPDRLCVINGVKPYLMGRGIVPEISDIAEQLRIPIAGMIPYDENIPISVNIGTPVVMERGSYLEKNFTRIVNRILFGFAAGN